jgi:hypothetical protein
MAAKIVGPDAGSTGAGTAIVVRGEQHDEARSDRVDCAHSAGGDRRQTVVLTVAPAIDPDGRRACSSRGPLFNGAVDGRQLVTRSTQPLLDAARILVAEGADPSTRIVMRHAGKPDNALTALLGIAARLTVVEERDGVPRFRPWKAFSRPAVTPPSAPSDLAAIRNSRNARTRQRPHRRTPGAGGRPMSLNGVPGRGRA